MLGSENKGMGLKVKTETGIRESTKVHWRVRLKSFIPILSEKILFIIYQPVFNAWFES